QTGMARRRTAGAQVGQEVADVERGIGAAESVKIHDKGPLTVEEQLARLEPPVCRTIRVGLERLQACRKLLREPLCRCRLGRVVGGDQGGRLARALCTYRFRELPPGMLVDAQRA